METNIGSIENLNLTPEQRKAVGFLAEFTKRLVLFGFPGHKTPTRALNVIKEIYRVTDDVVAGCFIRGSKPPCKAGCSWCCFLRVKATPLEVMCIVDYLRARLIPGEISALQDRLLNTDDITRGLDGIQRISAKIMCPLLVDGKCLAYPVRPIVCRVYHSLNPLDCEASLDKNGGKVTIRQDISGLSMGIIAGLTEGLRSVGLQTRLLELTAGLRIAMDESGSRLVKKWLSGELTFLEAEIAGAKRIDSFHRALMEELGEPLLG